MSKDDYEYDYDDDGNEIKIRITKAMLKARLAAAEKRAEDSYKAYNKAQKELNAARRRQDNAYWCDKLKTVLDDGTLIATTVAVEVKADYVDVTNRRDAYTSVIPGSKQAYLTVTFTGDEALLRFGNFLKEAR